MTTNEDKLNAWWAAQVQAARTTNVHWDGDVPALVAAIAKAQAAMPAAAKNKENPHFGNAYADLGSVLECIMPALNKEGCALMQFPGWDAERGLVTMTTVVAGHGGSVTSTAASPLGRGSGPQAVGSAITYLRRYAAQSILSLPAVDDDANAAQGNAPAPARQATAPTNGPSCPDCGGPMWDNREGKKNDKAPDFKCKKGRDQCNGAIWPDRDAPKAEGAGTWSDAERRGFWKIMGELKIEKWMLDEFVGHTNHRRQPADHMKHPKNMTEPERVELLSWFSSAAGVQVLNDIRDDLNAEAAEDFHHDQGPF